MRGAVMASFQRETAGLWLRGILPTGDCVPLSWHSILQFPLGQRALHARPVQSPNSLSVSVGDSVLGQSSPPFWGS